MSLPSLVLFDIDGTLLAESSDHLQVLSRVAAKHLQIEVKIEVVNETPTLFGRSVAGMIDAELIRTLINQARRHGASILADLMAEYGEEYRVQIKRGNIVPGRILPGAMSFMDRLDHHNIPRALSTGNSSVVAKTKLTAVGLAGGFDFDPSLGFGDHHANRTAMVDAALAGIHPRDVLSKGLLVGDTAPDMRAATAAGVFAAAVLTGSGNEEELRLAGADRIFSGMPAVQSFCFSPESSWGPVDPYAPK